MQILEVLIEYGISSLDRTFSYCFLGEKKVEIGVRVLVNFNNKDIIGYVVDVKEINQSLEEYQNNSPYIIKEITKIIDDQPLLNDELQKLAKDISNYYFSPLISVFQVMLPPSLKPMKSSLKKPKISYEAYVKLIDEDEYDLTPKQIETLRLIKSNQLVLKKDLKSHIVKNLLAKGKIELIYQEKMRLVQEEVIKKNSHKLNDEQQLAVDSIVDEKYKTYLIEGVTGSGKTEVYLEATKRIIEKGKKVIVLVPEISLTHQMVRRFKERFDNIAILHSSLTPGEKYDEYRRIRQGNVDIVIGARSAIFAPLKDIGLIIIDEEHSDTYKQENQPYYHAIKVGLMRQKYHDCKLVLGSATPSLETKIRAMKKIYHQLYLHKRYNSSPLPNCEIVNMGDYNNIDNDSFMFSKLLRNKIQERLNKKQQIILLINKRGYAPYVQCAKCKKVLKCPECGVVLSYHFKDDMLKCHHCGHVELMLKKCYNCDGSKFYKIGFGIEKVEEEVNKLFPQAKVARLDSDIASLKNKIKDTLDQFNNREIDILIGTQMIAKGHDFKNVTLVGVVLADLGLNIPSFKSNERTFNLLTQAIGRAGRDEKSGEAVIQTYLPNHFVIYDSSTQDYNRFFNEEMQCRKLTQMPPYTYLILINLSSQSEDLIIDASHFVKTYLDGQFANKKVDVIGPSEPYANKVNGAYQRKILVKFKDRNDVETVLKELIEAVNKRKNLKIQFNVDPDNDY